MTENAGPQVQAEERRDIPLDPLAAYLNREREWQRGEAIAGAVTMRDYQTAMRQQAARLERLEADLAEASARVTAHEQTIEAQVGELRRLRDENNRLSSSG